MQIEREWASKVRRFSMSLERYSFCFLRYFHEPLSGEFANVGVLLWAPDSQFLGFRSSQRYLRLSRFFLDFRSRDYRHLISRINTQFQKLATQVADGQTPLDFAKPPETARELALQVIPHDDSALQWSPSGGGVTADPQAELEALYREVVGRHYDAPDEPRRDDQVIYREVFSKAFENPAVKEHFTEHRVETSLVSHVFPQAWKNGVWNVYQPLSFDLKRDEDINSKALKWGNLSRFVSEAAEKPKVHLLLGVPSEGHGRAYSQAKDVLLASSREIVLVEENEADDFARDLSQRVAASS